MKFKPDNHKSFEVDGKVIDNPTAPFIEEKKEEKNRGNRLLILILSVACVIFLVAFLMVLGNLNILKNKYETIAVAYLANKNASELISQKEEEIGLLKSEIDFLRRDNELLIENSDRTDGIFFEVQIGAFKDFNLDQYLQNLSALRQEKHDNRNKIILGKFRSFDKALLFENDIKRMGFDEAFIIGRVDGKLMPYQDALALLKKK
jgi:hypothetical protein